MDKLAFLQQNPLFQGIPENQLQHILPIVRELAFKKGDVIIRENEVSDTIYLIKSGEVEISKHDLKHDTTFRIAILKEGDIVGEITLLDNAPRSASVRANKDCVLYAISAHELRSISTTHLPSKIIADKLTLLAQEAISIASEPIYSMIIQNLAKNLGQRIRTTSDTVVESLGKELEHMKARASMSTVLIVTLCFLSIYTVVIKTIASIPGLTIMTPTLLTVPLLGLFSIGMFIILKQGGYPLKSYGFTLQHWKYNIIESLVFTIPLLIVILLFKWVLIHRTDALSSNTLFEMSAQLKTQDASLILKITMIALYLIFVPIQELVVRGGLQSSFQMLIVGPHRILWAILLSNIMFSVTHLHLSLLIAFVVMIPGLFWGWLYARQHSLVGVIASHLITGIWAIFIVGFGV